MLRAEHALTGIAARFGLRARRPVAVRCGSVRVERCQFAGSAADLCRVVHTPFGVRAIIGRVAGPGAAGLAAEVAKGFTDLARHEIALAGIAFRIDAFLSGRQYAERFVTAVMVQIAGDGRSAEVVICGHPPPRIVRDGQVFDLRVLPVALPLGLQEMASDWCTAAWFALREGDGLLLRSTGHTPSAGHHYRFPKRIHKPGDPPDLVARFAADPGHAGHRRRDTTLLYLVPDKHANPGLTPPLSAVPALGTEWGD